jgi:carotenoid cleavage dioxygenase-like enzyme
MKSQVHHRFASQLPADDAHPYRTGAWRPQTTEWDAWELDVKGEIPKDLAGTYLRNTENPLTLNMQTYHPFDGDGMLHSITFTDGEARYANRFVRTDGLREELEAGHALYAGIAEPPTLAERPGWGARGFMKDAASTDVVVHAGKALASFYQCGELYRLDPVTLADEGRVPWVSGLNGWGVSAHTKVDENTGELLFFSYSKQAPYLRYGIAGPDGSLSYTQDIALPGPRLPHDMAFTENYAILNDCPMFWNPELLAKGIHANKFYRDLPTRFAIVPRHGGDVRWFEADPTFVLHWTNAYEDGDDIVLDGFFQEDPSPASRPDDTPDDRLFRFLDLYRMKAKAHRWRFNLRTGGTTEHHLSDRIMEFPAINGKVGGRPYRYSYNAVSKPGWFLFNGLVKHDVVSGHEELVQLAEGVFCSEAVFAPRPNAKTEDDGWVLTYTIDVNADRSDCLIFDARSMSSGPVATVALPERIASGTHAFWAGAR